MKILVVIKIVSSVVKNMQNVFLAIKFNVSQNAVMAISFCLMIVALVARDAKNVQLMNAHNVQKVILYNIF